MRIAALAAGLAATGLTALALGTAGYAVPPPADAATVVAMGDPVRSTVPSLMADELRFDPPLAGELRLVHPFRAPASPWGAGHRGVDLAAAVGREVIAPASGTVTFSGGVVDRGVVTIGHAGGLRSSLEPVDPLVRAGERVSAGQPVAVVSAAAGHCAPEACLHWAVRRGATYLDPLDWLRGYGPIVLLPIDGPG